MHKSTARHGSRTRIKIVHLISDLSTGGAESALWRLVSRMDRSRYENVVVSLTDLGTLGQRIKVAGIPVYTLGTNPEGDSRAIGAVSLISLCLYGFWKFLLILIRERPQVLQTWLYHSDFLGLLAGKLAGVPVIAWNLRCTLLKSERNMAVPILALLSRYPDAVLVNSAAGKIFHEEKGYRPKKWIQIPNGFDAALFKPDMNLRRKIREELVLPPETLLIGLISRIDPLKGHDTFLRAARIVVEQQKNIHFVLAGHRADSKNESLVVMIAQLGLSPYVHLLGERQDIVPIISALDILTSSSTAEGFPNVVGEAMACAVPCVVTDVGDSAFLVGDTGKVIAPDNPEQLAQAWRNLMEMGSDDRVRMGAAARERVQACFEIGSVVKRYEQCYEQLVAARGVRGDGKAAVTT